MSQPEGAEAKEAVSDERLNRPTAVDGQNMSLDPLEAVAASWRLIVVIALLGALCLALLYALTSDRYSSSTTILFRSGDPSSLVGTLPTGFGSGNSDRALNTQADVILSDAVVEPAARAVGSTASAVRRSIEVETGIDSDVLTLSGQANTASGAQRLTAALADAYVSLNRQEGVRFLETQAEALQAPIASLTARLDALTVAGSVTPADESRRAALVVQLTELTQEQERLRTNAEIYAGQVVVLSAADKPDIPSSPSPTLGAVQGAALSIVLGVLLALARALGGKRLRSGPRSVRRSRDSDGRRAYVGRVHATKS